MSTVLPQPQIEFEIDIGVGQSALSGVWDAGIFDVGVWGQTDTSLGDWVDVTCDVVDGVTMGAGASSADGVVTRWEAATLTFALVGAQYDPRSGPWAGIIGPATQARMRWRAAGAPDWHVGFVGFVDDEGFAYDPKTRVADISCTDSTRIFTAYDGLEQSPIGQGETAAQRVTRIADMVGWPIERRDIQAGGVPVQATTLAGEAWTMLLQVADTDLALLWLTRDGMLAYRPQGKVTPQRELAAIVGCGEITIPPGSVQIVPVEMVAQQPTITRNIVSISRQSSEGVDAVTATVRDEGSIARYFPMTYQRTDLIHTDDLWSTRVAEAVLTSSAWPSSAPQSIELDSRADLQASALLLGLEPSLAVTVTDGASSWVCEPAGWSVEIYRSHIAGEIRLLDESIWFGSGWDGAEWDHTESKWGF